MEKRRMDAKGSLLERLKQQIDTIPIADAHEHLMERQESLGRDVDLFDLFDRSYVKADFVSAGMPAQEWAREECDPDEGWERIGAHIHKVRNTSYYQSLLGALRDLYDFTDDELDDRNWRELSDRIHSANMREDWYHHVLKEKARVEVCLLHVAEPGLDHRVFDTDRRFCLPVLWVDPLLYGHSNLVLLEDKGPDQQVLRFGRQVLEEQHGVSLNGFDDYLNLVDTAFESALKKGAVAAKSLVAYQRVLRFDPVGESEAEKIFVKPDNEIRPAEAKAFQDYVMHRIIQKTIEYELPFQVHTGLQHGFGNILDNSNPLHLNNLLLTYPQAKFVLLHGSYPYSGELSVLAKTYSNVYLDFSWLPLISPSVADRNLAEWLDTVPGSKLGWGGDCQHVEAIYGHVVQLRRVVTRVLTEKVVRGYFDEEIAIDLARKLLRDNVWELYNLKEKREDRTLS